MNTKLEEVPCFSKNSKVHGLRYKTRGFLYFFFSVLWDLFEIHAQPFLHSTANRHTLVNKYEFFPPYTGEYEGSWVLHQIWDKVSSNIYEHSFPPIWRKVFSDRRKSFHIHEKMRACYERTTFITENFCNQEKREHPIFCRFVNSARCQQKSTVWRKPTASLSQRAVANEKKEPGLCCVIGLCPAYSSFILALSSCGELKTMGFTKVANSVSFRFTESGLNLDPDP